MGPTATGKTAIAVELSDRLNAEIISVDSAAVYRGMDVGTAKPTCKERSRAAFHLIDVVDPSEPFNVHLFRGLALQAISEIRARGRRPILVGGTGLYLRAVLSGMGLTAAPADPGFRTEMETLANQHGTAYVHSLLVQRDPVQAAKIHPNDMVRTVRALEVFHSTGMTMSDYQARDRANREPLKCRTVCVYADRDVMDRRIDERAERMMVGGLVAETQALLDSGLSSDATALRMLGYHECADYLQGHLTMEAAIAEIKRNTRRFARRQLTWFRREPDLVWLDITGLTNRAAEDRVLGALLASEP